MPLDMFGMRILNLDRREYIEINGVGTMITYNGSVPAKKKGTNWSARQSTRGNSYSYSNSTNSYNTAIMMYGYFLITSQTINQAFKDTLDNKLSEKMGSWNGNRIIIEYKEINGSYPTQVNKYSNVSNDAKALGNNYLTFDKVLQ